MTWIEWFCSLSGNECLCEIPYEFMKDLPNYYGLNKLVANYDKAYDVLAGNIRNKKEIQDIEKDVIDLYYLFHQRYIFTEDGLSEMRRKYEKQVFGNCPRYFCDMCPLLPIGLSLELRKTGILLYCPCCKEIYTPSREDVAAIDGCAYGPNFPMEFFIHFPHFLQCGSLETYEPKLYGMAISEESPAYREGRYIKNHSKNKENIE